MQPAAHLVAAGDFGQFRFPFTADSHDPAAAIAEFTAFGQCDQGRDHPLDLSQALVLTGQGMFPGLLHPVGSTGAEQL